jgi:hypothetical protein
VLQDDYQSPLPEKYRWRNWAADAEGMTGDALKQFMDNDLFPACSNWKPEATISARLCGPFRCLKMPTTT